MNIALFGGTFDPIHSGHLKAAEAARRKFRLDRILFVPTGHPPHKSSGHLTAFEHRYAMVALACSGSPRFVPSLLEAPSSDGRPSYSVETVRKARRLLGARDHLYFIIGADAFFDLPQWKDYHEILELANFIVVSRPGFDPKTIGEIVPRDLLQGQTAPRAGRIALRRTTLHILDGMQVPLSSRQIREAARRGRWIAGCVAPLVRQYIRKEGLYRPARLSREE